MAFVRESRGARRLPRVGPFALLFTDGTRLRFLNYAIPDDGADPDDPELDALVAAFHAADRIPRVEFDALLDEYPEIARGIIRTLIGHLRGQG